MAALDGKRVVLATALAHPDAFVADAAAHGARIAGDIRFRDHHAFTAADVERIVVRARQKDAAVLCSGKDWAKFGRLFREPPGVEWLVVRAGIDFLAGEAPVREALGRLGAGAVSQEN